LDSRSTRVPYSRYLKPQQHKASLGKQFINNLSPIFEIPQHEMSVTEALKLMRDPEAVAELAERAAAFVPDGSATQMPYTMKSIFPFPRSSQERSQPHAAPGCRPEVSIAETMP